MTAADEVIHALADGTDELVVVARSLSEDQLRTPTRPGQWTVAQALSHLGSGAVINLAVLQAALEGRSHPGQEANARVWDRWNAMGPVEQRDEFVTAVAALQAAYDGLDADTRAQLRVDMGFLPQPVDVATVARFRLNELSLHSWDVRATFAPEATLAPAAVPLLLDQVAMMIGWVAKPQHLDGVSADLAVTLADPATVLGLHLGEQVTLGEPPQDADGVLSISAEAWLRLVTGRLPDDRDQGDVTLTGPVDLDTLRRVFPGF